MLVKIIDKVKADSDVFIASVTGKLKGDIYFFTDNMMSDDCETGSYSHPYEDQKPGNRVTINEWMLCIPAKFLMKLTKCIKCPKCKTPTQYNMIKYIYRKLAAEGGRR